MENSFADLDRRNSIFEKNLELINQTKNELDYQITKNTNEERRILEQKNNLKIRQDMVDSLRIKYVGDITNSPFEFMPKTFNDNDNKKPHYINNNIEEFKNNHFSTVNQNEFSGFNFANNTKYNEYNYKVNNKESEKYINNNQIKENNNKNLSIIEENNKYSENSLSNQDN